MNTLIDTDRIERQILLEAPRARVWRALTDPQEFGRWFGVRLSAAEFRVGEEVHGNCTYPGYEHLTWRAVIERLEPQRLFSWRWHPAAIDPAVDYSGEPTTLVEFTLEDAEGGTLLSVRESGFDAVPAARRASAYRMNTNGWEHQMVQIERHVAAP